MSNPCRMRVAVCLVVLAGLLAGPVSGAAASGASIKAAVESFNGRVLTAEGHIVSAIGEYKTSKQPAGVESALTASISVLGSLRAKVAAQGAVRPRVKLARTKIVRGLALVMVAYEHLKTAFADKATSPEAAETAATAALATVKSARKQLSEGVKLLR